MNHNAHPHSVSRTDGLNEAIKKKTLESLTLISQNVQGLKSEERIEELCSALRKRKTFAACIQETWRSNKELLKNRDYMFITNGLPKEKNLSNRGAQGVAIALSPEAQSAWIAAGSIIHDDCGCRVMAIRMKVKDSENRDIFIFLISAYAPIGKADQVEWDEFFTDLSHLMSKKQDNDILILGADTNSSMGCSKEYDCLGNFGIDYVNESGLRLASYLTISRLTVLTTCFRKRSYGTWVHPRSKRKHQIDHFITNKSHKHRFIDAGLTTQLIYSDHMAIKCKVRLQVRLKKKTPPRQFLLSRDYSFTSPNAKTNFCDSVIHEFNKNDNESLYGSFEKAIRTVSKTLPRKQKVQPGWFQSAENDLLPLIEKRNTIMNACLKRRTRNNTKTLKNIRKAIKKRVKKAKNDWIKQKQNDMSFENNSNNTKKCWDALKDLKNGCSKTRPIQITKMKKEEGSLYKNAEENTQVFYKHFKNLYGQKPKYDESVTESIPQHATKTGIDHTPTPLEINTAVHKLKENAPGESGIPSKVWKVLTSCNRTFDILKNIVIDFWTTELTPKQWEKGLLKILP